MSIKLILKEKLEVSGAKRISLEVKGDKVLFDKLMEQTKFLNEKEEVGLSERIFCILNNLREIKICSNCRNKEVKFNGLGKGYSTYCSTKCMSNSKEIRDKSKNTIKERYGGVHFNATEEVKKKRKITNLEKYGVEHVLQNEDVRNKIENTNLKKYGHKTPLKNKSIKDKIKKTIIKKYGVDNVSKSQEVKDLKTATTFSNYGVLYPLQSEEIRNKMDKTMVDRYGEIHSSHIDASNKKREQTWLDKYGVKNPLLLIGDNGVSKSSQELFWGIYSKLSEDLKSKTYFSELNKEFNVKSGDLFYYYDFVISNKKIAIEFNGDYWHCNPKVYEPDFIHEHIGKTAEEIWEYDYRKLEALKERGFEVYVVWESDYTKNKDEIVSKFIELFISDEQQG